MRRVAGLGCALAALCPGGAAATDTRDARVELVTTSTLFGVGVGLLASGELRLNARPAAWLTAGVAGAAMFGAYRLGEDLRLSTADVRFIETTALWAGVDTALAFGAADQADGALWTSIGVAAAGGGVAVLTRGGVGASEGQLSLVNSGALWVPVAGVLTGLTLELDSDNLARDVLLLNLVGLGLGAALCAAYDPTREQVLYLDGGVLVGGLAGGLAGTMVGIAADAWAPIPGLAVVGMGAGGALAVQAYGFGRRGKRGQSSAAGGGSGATVMLPLAGGVF